MPNDNNIAIKQIPAKTGTVVSDKMNKTIIVRIDSVAHHRQYGKVLRRVIKVKAHDEKNTAKAGDIVRIVQVRPLSKDKRWKLVEVINPVRKDSGRGNEVPLHP